jgi:hypothetical protein
MRKMLFKPGIVEMEGSLKAVFVEHFNKAAVLDSSVIIAEGNASLLAILPKCRFYKFHKKISFVFIYRIIVAQIYRNVKFGFMGGWNHANATPRVILSEAKYHGVVFCAVELLP